MPDDGHDKAGGFGEQNSGFKHRAANTPPSGGDSNLAAEVVLQVTERAIRLSEAEVATEVYRRIREDANSRWTRVGIISTVFVALLFSLGGFFYQNISDRIVSDVSASVEKPITEDLTESLTTAISHRIAFLTGDVQKQVQQTIEADIRDADSEIRQSLEKLINDIAVAKIEAALRDESSNFRRTLDPLIKGAIETSIKQAVDERLREFELKMRSLEDLLRDDSEADSSGPTTTTNSGRQDVSLDELTAVVREVTSGQSYSGSDADRAIRALQSVLDATGSTFDFRVQGLVDDMISAFASADDEDSVDALFDVLQDRGLISELPIDSVSALATHYVQQIVGEGQPSLEQTYRDRLTLLVDRLKAYRISDAWSTELQLAGHDENRVKARLIAEEMQTQLAQDIQNAERNIASTLFQLALLASPEAWGRSQTREIRRVGEATRRGVGYVAETLRNLSNDQTVRDRLEVRIPLTADASTDRGLNGDSLRQTACDFYGIACPI